MAGRPAVPENPESGRTPEAVLALTRQLLAELHPGVAWIRPVALDSALERDLGLDSLSRVELAVRVERAFAVSLPEKALAEIVTLRDLLAALQEAPAISSAAAPGPPSARWSEPAQAYPHDAATLVEALDWHVRAHPDRVHIVCIGDEIETQISYRELHRQVEFVAAGLQRQGLEPRQTVAIMLPTSPEYFHTYFGILLAGGIPVPIYPPARMSQIEEHVRRHAGILSNAEASILVTVPEARGVARLLEARVAGLRRVVTVAELKERQDAPRPVPVGQDDIAFIQYTSGSTGEPKGVVLTHGNLHGQHPRDGRGRRRQAGRRTGELAAALSRHGADQHVAVQPLLRDSAGGHVAACLPGAPGALAARDPALPRHDLRGAELRLRAVREAHRRRAARRAGPAFLAHGLQRRRAGAPRNAAPLHRTVRALRFPGKGHGPGVRPRRMHGRPAVSADGSRAAHGPRAPPALQSRRAGRARGRRRCQCAALRLVRTPVARTRRAHRRCARSAR